MLHELVCKLVQLEFVAKVCKPGAPLYLSPGAFVCIFSEQTLPPNTTHVSGYPPPPTLGQMTPLCWGEVSLKRRKVHVQTDVKFPLNSNKPLMMMLVASVETQRSLWSLEGNI